MRISLRKANALQTLIQEQINEPFVGEVTVSKYDNGLEVIGEATTKLTNTIEKKFNLIQVLFSIRKKVSVGNAESGVDGHLTDLAENERTVAFLKQLTKTSVFAPKKDVLDKALADLVKEKEPTKDTYGRLQKEVLSVSLLSKDSLESYTKSLSLLRKQKQVISDRLLHLNVSTEIELGDAEVGVLKKYDIL